MQISKKNKVERRKFYQNRVDIASLWLVGTDVTSSFMTDTKFHNIEMVYMVPYLVLVYVNAAWMDKALAGITVNGSSSSLQVTFWFPPI